eukprot:scpid38413/ scgid10175/ 
MMLLYEVKLPKQPLERNPTPTTLHSNSSNPVHNLCPKTKTTGQSPHKKTRTNRAAPFYSRCAASIRVAAALDVYLACGYLALHSSMAVKVIVMKYMFFTCHNLCS